MHYSKEDIAKAREMDLLTHLHLKNRNYLRIILQNQVVFTLSILSSL